METYFIRHTKSKCSVDDNTRERMWKERRIFIHFPWDKYGNARFDSKSKKSEDYEKGHKRALSALQRLASQGGYVCAHYVEHDKWLMGFVPPKSKVNLFSGKWRPEDRPKRHNGIAVIKTLRLRKTRLVSPYDYAVLQSAQPRQGTIMRWPSIENLVQDLVERKRPKITFEGLGAGDQEVMCAEFLRLPNVKQFSLPQLICLLRGIGRTMKDLDILGFAQDGKRIFCQVTHCHFETKDAREKLKVLKKFQHEKGVHLLLFCICDKRETLDKVVVFPLQQVFQHFVATNLGKQWKKHLVCGS